MNREEINVGKIDIILVHVSRSQASDVRKPRIIHQPFYSFKPLGLAKLNYLWSHHGLGENVRSNGRGLIIEAATMSKHGKTFFNLSFRNKTVNEVETSRVTAYHIYIYIYKHLK